MFASNSQWIMASGKCLTYLQKWLVETWGPTFHRLIEILLADFQLVVCVLGTGSAAMSASPPCAVRLETAAREALRALRNDMLEEWDHSLLITIPLVLSGSVEVDIA